MLDYSPPAKRSVHLYTHGGGDPVANSVATERCLPSSVFGQVLFLALARLAWICLSELIEVQP
jgi:hypothetical protein